VTRVLPEPRPIPARPVLAPSLARRALGACVVLGLACAQTPEPEPSPAPAEVDAARIIAAPAESWLSHGRDYAEQRFSPLRAITRDNVARLGLAWSVDLGTRRGLEATPIVAHGTLYTTGTWSVVHAFDAATGERRWTYDPEVPRSRGRWVCCDVVNRGVAIWKGRLYVGTLDGRLIALDRETGRPVWEVSTIDRREPYAITGAPRVVKGLVVIGNGGAELGVRGYFSAYDAATGALRWRFYTVPGDPSQPPESKALEAALPTWKGDVWWKVGGGGTVWDSFAYDPELDLLYVGTGNGSPWAREVRSPGGGDNLYLSSILAVRPDTGELVWHYQTTPGDNWDFTATQQMILADFEIDGRPREVLMQAPKNGFFYVLDRATGELLSAEPFARVTWASEVDQETGRPVETGAGTYVKGRPANIFPSSMGAHNWHSMAFHPETGLVYIPAQEVPGRYVALTEPFEYRHASYENAGVDFSQATEFPAEYSSGSLLAWDPVAGRARWSVAHPTAGNGGVLATAGGLVFQGTATGRFVAYDAADGRALWEHEAGTGVIAAPVSYAIDGVQYVAVMAGWGGAFGLAGGDAAAAAGVRSVGRLLVFRLDGNAHLSANPPPPEIGPRPPAPGPEDREAIRRGEVLYAIQCAACHGVGAVHAGVLPDLRFLRPSARENFDAIVRGGALSDRGMPKLDDVVDERGLQDLLLYLAARAQLAAEP